MVEHASIATLSDILNAYLINGQIYIHVFGLYLKKITALLQIILTSLFRIHYNQPDLKNTNKLLYKQEVFIM